MSRLQKIEEKFVLKTTSCWQWLGCTQRSGRKRKEAYGSVQYEGKVWRAHRLFYTLYKGEIPKGLHVLHACDNVFCVKPEHLFVGTHVDNMQDKLSKNRDHNKKKTHCLKGHPFSGDNLIVRKDGARSCRECMRVYWNKFDAKNREARRVKALQRYYAKKGGTL